MPDRVPRFRSVRGRPLHGPARSNRLPVRGEDFALSGGNGRRRGRGDVGAGVGARARRVHERGDRGGDHRPLRDRLGLAPAARPRCEPRSPRTPASTTWSGSGSFRRRDANDNTVQTTFGRLRPNTTYHYRFCFLGGSPCSAVGRFLTAPSPSTNKTIRFAYSGDETGVAAPGQTKPFWGNFKAFQSMVAEHNDFNIDFGDTIYSDPEVPGATTATTVPQKWGMYRKKLAVPNMQSIRAATGLYNHWDDHEFINDFSDSRERAPALQPKREGVPRLRAGHVQRRTAASTGPSAGARTCSSSSSTSARSEAARRRPTTSATTPTPASRTWRRRRRRAPATRSRRWSPPSPSRSRRPARTRSTARTEPSSARRSSTGSSTTVKSSNAKWKVVMNETPIQQFYALPYDRWEGYATERVRLLQRAADRQRQPPRLPDHRHPRGARQRGPLPDPARRRRARQRSDDRPLEQPLPGLRHRARGRRRRSGRRSTRPRAEAATAS